MALTYHTKSLPIGLQLREWVLEEVLGAGGFAIVYRARGIYFDEPVAIKEYFPAGITDRRGDGMTVSPTESGSEETYTYGLGKFISEARILWNLSRPERHPNIVCVRNLFEANGTAYMVMDFEDGEPLSRILRAEPVLSQARLWSIFRPLMLGLARVHDSGIFHRDIKPGNILVDRNGRPVLIDFGSAKIRTNDNATTRFHFYTPSYAALEQYVEAMPQGPWTDIYGLAATMVQCITGEKPADVLVRAHSSSGESLAARAPAGYDPSFLAAVDAGFAVNPTDRPQAMADWLAMFPDTTIPEAVPPMLPERLETVAPVVEIDETRVAARTVRIDPSSQKDGAQDSRLEPPSPVTESAVQTEAAKDEQVQDAAPAAGPGIEDDAPSTPQSGAPELEYDASQHDDDDAKLPADDPEQIALTAPPLNTQTPQVRRPGAMPPPRWRPKALFAGTATLLLLAAAGWSLRSNGPAKPEPASLPAAPDRNSKPIDAARQQMQNWQLQIDNIDARMRSASVADKEATQQRSRLDQLIQAQANRLAQIPGASPGDTSILLNGFDQDGDQIAAQIAALGARLSAQPAVVPETMDWTARGRALIGRAPAALKRFEASYKRVQALGGIDRNDAQLLDMARARVDEAATTISQFKSTSDSTPVTETQFHTLRTAMRAIDTQLANVQRIGRKIERTAAVPTVDTAAQQREVEALGSDIRRIHAQIEDAGHGSNDSYRKDARGLLERAAETSKNLPPSRDLEGWNRTASALRDIKTRLEKVQLDQRISQTQTEDKRELSDGDARTLKRRIAKDLSSAKSTYSKQLDRTKRLWAKLDEKKRFDPAVTPLNGEINRTFNILGQMIVSEQALRSEKNTDAMARIASSFDAQKNDFNASSQKVSTLIDAITEKISQ